MEQPSGTFSTKVQQVDNIGVFLYRCSDLLYMKLVCKIVCLCMIIIF